MAGRFGMTVREARIGEARRFAPACLIGLLSLVSLSIPFAAADTTLIGTWTQGDWIVPVTRGKVLYGASKPNADFAVSQWGNPAELSPFSAARCPPQRTDCFRASSPNITDFLYTDSRGDHWVDLDSKGLGKPCFPAPGYELDNLEAAIGRVYKTYPQAVRGSAKLGAISHLYVSVTAEPIAFSTLQGAQCPSRASGAGMLLAVVLNDRASRQTLFYQLRLHGYPIQVGPGFFSNRQPFGFRDTIGMFGVYENGLPLGRPTAIRLDLLPRLKAVLSTAANGLDRKVQNWTTGSVYMGQNVFGNVRAETAWCCFSLAAVSRTEP